MSMKMPPHRLPVACLAGLALAASSPATAAEYRYVQGHAMQLHPGSPTGASFMGMQPGNQPGFLARKAPDAPALLGGGKGTGFGGGILGSMQQLVRALTEHARMEEDLEEQQVDLEQQLEEQHDLLEEQHEVLDDQHDQLDELEDQQAHLVEVLVEVLEHHLGDMPSGMGKAAEAQVAKAIPKHVLQKRAELAKQHEAAKLALKKQHDQQAAALALKHKKEHSLIRDDEPVPAPATRYAWAAPGAMGGSQGSSSKGSSPYGKVPASPSAAQAKPFMYMPFRQRW